MKLSDLRKLSIRQNLQVRFRLRNGRDCVITEHGLAQVPGWKGIPDFSLEAELAAAGEFLLEPVVRPGQKNPPLPRRLDRQELSALAHTGGAAPEHEEE